MMASIFRKKRNLLLLVIGFMAAIFITSGVMPPLSVISNYQGIHPSFEAVYYNGELYTNENPLNASTNRFHPSSFDFDPDESDEGLPNLRGELRDIMIVRDLGSYEIGDVASHIINMGGSAEMPYKEYTWEVPVGDDTHVYRMENWLCSMEINLWVDPTEGDFWTWLSGSGEIFNKKYESTEVWLKLETGPGWYYDTDPPDELYFGLGYVELALLTSEEGHENPEVEIMPESRWAAFSMYDSLGGSLENVETPIAQANSFKGTLLNPDVFQDVWYIPITIDSFGVFDYDNLDGAYNTDSIQLKVLVHVFVVGEWVVQPLEEERDMEEHDSSEEEGWIAPLIESVKNTFRSPWVKLYLAALPVLALALYFGPRWFRRGDA